MFFNKDNMLPTTENFDGGVILSHDDFNLLTELAAMAIDEANMATVEEANIITQSVKIGLNEHNKLCSKYWREGKRLQKEGKFNDAIKKYNLSIEECKKLDKIVDKIPNDSFKDKAIHTAIFGVVLLSVMGGYNDNYTRNEFKKANTMWINKVKERIEKCKKKEK